MIAHRALSAGLIVPPTHGFVACESRPWESKPGVEFAPDPQPKVLTAAEKLAMLVRDEELILHCQEVVRLNARIDAPLLLDVSIRLRGEEDGQTMPGLFLGLIESDELMGELDRRIIERALDWCLTARPGRDVILNLSPTLESILAPDFASFVEGAVRGRQLDPGVLCLEISEDVASALPPSAQPNVESLTRLGCNFAVGSATCSTSSRMAMRALRAQFMRISGSLVQNLIDCAASLTRVAAANRVCQGTGVHTVAERVEDASVLRHLEEIGVSYAQGLNVENHRPLAFYG
ncbi:MAG: EAL domain-containing protein [Betaproteobacteria bacterium]|jgi:EAL domain-containing protein (putative c-di-GMP-specific phosphodiesterase class I)|nr:EAL domain-containing protein [Betaproteobacteria bacterium]